jgi:hypothetical protein
MPHDQQDLARIVDQLAGGDMAPTLLAELSDDQLATVGRIAAQRRSEDQQVIIQVGVEFKKNRAKTWREIAELLGLESHGTVYRWVQQHVNGGL